MKIGIIITSYNKEKTIKDCVRSVKQLKLKVQDRDCLELLVVVVDDCSQDSSFEIVLEEKSSGAIDICKRNIANFGVSYSRNRGIFLCKDTDYITFLDADDTINSDFLLASLENLWGDLVLFNFRYIDNGVAKEQTFYNHDKALPNEEISDYILSYYDRPNIKSMFTTCWAKLYRTRILLEKSNAVFNEKMHLCEDTDFVFRFLSKQEKGVQFINENLYDHFRSVGNENFTKATFATNLDLKNQLCFVQAVRSSRSFMVRNKTDSQILEAKILQCLGAYLMIYTIRSCMQIVSLRQFFGVLSFWSKIYNRPLFRRSINSYSAKIANGNKFLPFLVRNRFYFFSIVVAFYLCRRRYFR